MEEQLTPTVQTRRANPVPWIVLALVAILAAVAIYILTAKKPPAPVAMAKVIPQDCVIAYTIDLSKTPEKQAALDVINDVFKDAGVDDPEEWLFNLLKEGYEGKAIDWQKDVVSHINYKAGLAILGNSGSGVMMQPEMAFVIGAKGDADAKALYEVIKKSIAADGGQVGESTYDGVSYLSFSSGNDNLRCGAVSNVVVVANSDGAFKKIVDTTRGKLPNLAAESSYRQWLQVKRSTIMTEYYSGKNYYEQMLKPMFASAGGGMPEDVRTLFEDIFTELQAMVVWADASGDGIHGQAVGVTKSDMFDTTKESLDDLASVAPQDAAFLMNGTGWDKVWAKLKDKILSVESIKKDIDQGIQTMKAAVGIDPLADVLDRIKSGYVYYVPRYTSSIEYGGLPGHIVLGLGVDQPSRVGNVLSRIKGMLAMSPAGFEEISIAGHKVTVSPDMSGTGVRFGFTMSGDKLIFALSGTDIKEAFTLALNAAGGKGPSLADSAAFKLAKKDLPAEASMLFYGDAEPLLNVFKDEFQPKDWKVVRAILKRVSAGAGTMSASGTELQYRFTMPFKK